MSKDYIWELPKYGFSFNFLFFMILNQIWLFLVSFGPLIFWLLSSYLICYYFWIENLKDILKINFSVWNVLFLVFYSIFIPSFVLSFQDIKWFFISIQEDKLPTFFWSLINTWAFMIFLYSFWNLFFDSLVIFSIMFLLMFLLQLFMLLIFRIIILLTFLRK